MSITDHIKNAHQPINTPWFDLKNRQ